MVDPTEYSAARAADRRSALTAPWQAAKDGKAWNVVHASGVRFLSFPCGRKVHARMLAELVSSILPDIPDGPVPDDVMARLYVLRTSFYSFEPRDSSRSLAAAKDAWFDHVMGTTVWERTDGMFGYECVRGDAKMMGEGWRPVPMQPAIFGGDQ
jgi:hypothetical protein